MEGRDKTIQTGVDDLLELLGGIDRIAIQDAAKRLHVEVPVLQTWVDFLIEENIVGIEYKFITPYIYLVKKSSHKESEHKDPLEIKEEFYKKALARNMPLSRVNMLWNQYLSKNIIEIKEQFVAKGKGKGMDEQAIEKLWSKYKIYLVKSQHT